MTRYSVKMRASKAHAHISGAEKIVTRDAVASTLATLAERALSHPKGTPDFVNLKVELPGKIQTLKALTVTTHVTKSAAEGRAKATELLRSVGITRIDEIMARFSEATNLRGAMLLDADTLERLEPDHKRGVRATYMDDAESAAKETASGKNHYAEAIVLATKVQAAPHIVGEICVSDDPDYVTGYVATKELGYARITTIKEKGSIEGGRIFLYRGPREDVGATIDFLEHQAVLVEGVPLLEKAKEVDKWQSLEDDLAAIRAAKLDRHCEIANADRTILASNDYLGFAAELLAGSTGSRLTTGTTASHIRLETHLAEFKGTEAALVWGTGYMANVGTISALVKKGDIVFSDRLNHASIIDGCRLSGAEVVVYGHKNLNELALKLSAANGYRRKLVVSDAVFSMDGDILDLPRFLDICRDHNAFSMIDEAHATGVIGRTGRGLAEHFGCGHADITLGTLSKALGSEGGFVCARRLLIEYLRNTSRSFIFSTAPSAAVMDAADAALTWLEREPERVERLRANTRFFLHALAEVGVQATTESAIVPIVIGDEARALEVSEKLKIRGFHISAIRYPTVAKGAARLRVAISSEHTREELSSAARAIGDVLCS